MQENNLIYVAVTRAISVTVTPQFLPGESDPENSRFVWAYHVRIENNGEEGSELRYSVAKIDPSPPTSPPGDEKDLTGSNMVASEWSV